MWRMASSAYLSWITTKLTIVLTSSAMLFKVRSPSSHIPDTPLTSCSLLMSVYLYPFKKPMAQQSIPTRETRTGITNKLFFGFYSQTKRIAYTRANTKQLDA